MSQRSWFYPDGYHPRKADFPPKWDSSADPYPSVVQHKGRVYVRTARWQGGKGAPDVETDNLGFRTWTLYASNQAKHRWTRSAVALHQVLIRPVEPPLQDTVADPATYFGGSSVHYFSQQTGDHFAIIEDDEEIPSPEGIFTQHKDDWQQFKEDTFNEFDASTYLNPAFISDSPRWTQFHNEDDTVKTTTFTLNDGLGGTYEATVPDVPGWFVDTYPEGEGQGQFLNYTPGSDADLLVKGYDEPLGSIGTRPKPSDPLPDYVVTFPKRILVASRHFVGRTFTGYIEVVKQTRGWQADASLPEYYGIPEELQGHLDAYLPIISSINEEGQVIPLSPIPFETEQIPVQYTIQDEDWIHSPEFRPIDEDDQEEILIPYEMDVGMYVSQVILDTVAPGSSV